MPRPVKHIFVCAQNRPADHPRGSCSAKGAADVLQALNAEIMQRGLENQVDINACGCIGPCGAGPGVLVYPEGTLYSGVTPDKVKRIVEEGVLGDTPPADLLAPAAVW